MRPLRLLSRTRYRSTLSAPSGLRTEVRPPSLRHAPDSTLQRVIGWLVAPTTDRSAPPLNRLPGVRSDFIACLGDLPPDAMQPLADRITHSRSLRELWHLRADVYRVVGLHHSQIEAEQRLHRLNCHFPTRAPRSVLSSL